jgi:hypothetical protein
MDSETEVVEYRAKAFTATELASGPGDEGSEESITF